MLEGFLAQLREQNSLRLAVAGDGDGNVDVTDRPNWIYARLGSAGGEVAQVHVSVIHPNADDVIYVALDNPLGLAAWRMVFWLRDGSDPTATPPVVGSKQAQALLADSESVGLTDSEGEDLR